MNLQTFGIKAQIEKGTGLLAKISIEVEKVPRKFIQVVEVSTHTRIIKYSIVIMLLLLLLLLLLPILIFLLLLSPTIQLLVVTFPTPKPTGRKPTTSLVEDLGNKLISLPRLRSCGNSSRNRRMSWRRCVHLYREYSGSLFKRTEDWVSHRKKVVAVLDCSNLTSAQSSIIWFIIWTAL